MAGRPCGIGTAVSWISPSSRPQAAAGWLLGYLGGFAEGSATIENDALGLACTLSWDLDVFPYAWLWQELGATTGPPWLGLASTIAIEPATSFPGTGLGDVVETTATHRTLAAGATESTQVRLRLSALG